MRGFALLERWRKHNFKKFFLCSETKNPVNYIEKMCREKITISVGESTDTLGTSGPKKRHVGQFLEFSFCLLYPKVGPKVGNVEKAIGRDKRKKVLTKACSTQTKTRWWHPSKIDNNHSVQAIYQEDKCGPFPHLFFWPCCSKTPTVLVSHEVK